MDDPHDDTDVPSGTTDGAQMERTLPPVRLDYLAVPSGSSSRRRTTMRTSTMRTRAMRRRRIRRL